MRIRPQLFAITLISGVGVCCALLAFGPKAQSVSAAPAAVGVSNEYCLECHARPDQVKQLPSGESLYLTIDPALYAESVHGQGGYACVQCHTDITTYPHPESAAQDRRDVTLSHYETCQQCHLGNYEATLDSVHQAALDNGDKNAAVCSDCHNPHSQVRLTNPATHQLLPRARLQIPQTCARCHSAIYDQYKQSVHGQALKDFLNPDVPTCIDCHGVHDIGDPTTASFRLNSPNLCADCHTNAAIMDKYDISTQVLTTYLADFHGTTWTLFQKQNPDQVTNKPVCFDCHGVHNIARADDPQKGLSVKANLLTTCQRCHPEATPNFPDSWLSHYIPSPEKNSVVYYVNVFYQFFIPGVIGGMLIFVASDIGRRWLRRK
jgi:nitrate/TMAO reductase-like tetraheme cytochrome c subunit